MEIILSQEKQKLEHQIGVIWLYLKYLHQGMINQWYVKSVNIKWFINVKIQCKDGHAQFVAGVY